MNSDSLPLDRALLSMQRALWEIVTPELRAVVLRVSGVKVHARFVYDMPITDDILEIVDEADTEALADLPDGSRTDFTAEYLPPDQPRELSDDEVWVFLRREPGTT